MAHEQNLPASVKWELITDLLILPDGTVMAHNLTAVMAVVLLKLDPDDPSMKMRASILPAPGPDPIHHELPG